MFVSIETKEDRVGTLNVETFDKKTRELANMVERDF